MHVCLGSIKRGGLADDASDPDQPVRPQSHAVGPRRRRCALHISLRLGTAAVSRRTCNLSCRAFGPARPGLSLVGLRRPVPQADRDRKDLGLIEFCRDCETIELWFDPAPNDQLLLIWLLDHFRSHPEIAVKLKLRLIDFDLAGPQADELGRWKVPDVDVTEAEL